MTKNAERRITVKAEYVNGVAVLTCPSRYHLGHGVPGTAACKALLVMYERSGSDFRFHPTNCVWSHDSYHLANYKVFSEFVPKTFSTLPASLASCGQQLWPPNTWKGPGRPRLYPTFSIHMTNFANLTILTYTTTTTTITTTTCTTTTTTTSTSTTTTTTTTIATYCTTTT